MKNVLIFLGGLVTGIFLMVIVGYIYYKIGTNQNTKTNDPIHYLEKPVSYEGKTETSFEVFQVLGNAALATEESDRIDDDVLYYGNTVVILGENYYTDQVVTIKNPMRVGTYSYTNNGGMPMTVPVIKGEMK